LEPIMSIDSHRTPTADNPVAVLATVNPDLARLVKAISPEVDVVDPGWGTEGDPTPLAPTEGLLLLVPAVGDVLTALGAASALLVGTDLDDAGVWRRGVACRARRHGPRRAGLVDRADHHPPGGPTPPAACQ
jgi:hypothetical protein